MTDREVVEHALRIAIDWEHGLEGPDAEKRVLEYRRVLRRRYGNDSSYQELLASERAALCSVSVHELVNSTNQEKPE